MEHTSELVDIGKIIHENSYSRKRKEIDFEGIKIDFLEAKKGFIHEIKKSDALEDSHRWQMKYYLYYFKNLGIELQGIIDYPKKRKREFVVLESEDILILNEMINNINNLLSSTQPPKVNKKPYCKSCSYYDFCFC